jgi:hypothetical protein
MENVNFFIIKQPDASISEIIFEGKSTCFGKFLCPSSGDFHCKHSNVTRYTGFSDSLQAELGSWLQAVRKKNCIIYTIAICTE